MKDKTLIMIVDDDPNIAQLVKLYLEKDGYDTVAYGRGDEALAAFRQNPPSLMILDIMLPGMDGWQVCRAVRQISQIPIIMLTAKEETFDKVLGLELGADDYIVKPFSPREVLARIKAVLRRFEEKTEAPDKSVVRLPQLEVSLDNYQVKIMGQVVPCTPKEVEILYMLTSAPGQVFSREQILSRVWGYDYFGDTRTVDAHIKRIRQKLPAEGVKWALRTVYGVGYRFEVRS